MFSLAGCGFHLRGAANLPPQLHTLYLKSDRPFTPFMNELRSSLKLSGVHLTPSAKDAPYTLEISNETLNTQETSIGGSQQIRDYTATYSIQYDIKNNDGKTIYGPNTISDKQTITVLANEILTNSNKLNNAKRIMTQNLISKMMFALTSKNLLSAMQKNTPKKRITPKKIQPQHENIRQPAQ